MERSDQFLDVEPPVEEGPTQGPNVDEALNRALDEVIHLSKLKLDPSQFSLSSGTGPWNSLMDVLSTLVGFMTKSLDSAQPAADASSSSEQGVAVIRFGDLFAIKPLEPRHLKSLGFEPADTTRKKGKDFSWIENNIVSISAMDFRRGWVQVFLSNKKRRWVKVNDPDLMRNEFVARLGLKEFAPHLIKEHGGSVLDVADTLEQMGYSIGKTPLENEADKRIRDRPSGGVERDGEGRDQ